MEEDDGIKLIEKRDNDIITFEYKIPITGKNEYNSLKKVIDKKLLRASCMVLMLDNLNTNEKYMLTDFESDKKVLFEIELLKPLKIYNCTERFSITRFKSIFCLSNGLTFFINKNENVFNVYDIKNETYYYGKMYDNIVNNNIESKYIRICCSRFFDFSIQFFKNIKNETK